MEKIPCVECSVLILPSTAEANGGKCVPCKQGTRKGMAESRAYDEAQKAYDPYCELWASLVNRASGDSKLASFSYEEQRYFSVCLLEGEVYNGGFDQFFSNSSGAYYLYCVDGLKDVAAEASLAILKNAAKIIFSDNEPPTDRQNRWEMMQAAGTTDPTSEYHAKLNALDKQFWEDPDSLGDRLTGYAEKHGLVQPFLK
jgi:Domain of unknown function (DUF4375)